MDKSEVHAYVLDTYMAFYTRAIGWSPPEVGGRCRSLPQGGKGAFHNHEVALLFVGGVGAPLPPLRGGVVPVRWLVSGGGLGGAPPLVRFGGGWSPLARWLVSGGGVPRPVFGLGCGCLPVPPLSGGLRCAPPGRVWGASRIHLPGGS